MTATQAHADLVGRIRVLKARLLNALTESNFGEMRTVLQLLWRTEMTVEVLQETKIASTLTEARKATKRAKLNDLYSAARELITSWKALFTAPKSARSRPAPAEGASNAKRSRVNVQQKDAPQVSRKPVVERPLGPPATTTYTTFTKERRWQGVDGCVGPDGYWSSWSQPISLEFGHIASSGNPTVAGPYVVPV
eukprot:m.47224 g.47224  ORF g.47224 m.47224 type:complete len:194 (-) comp8832_c0_seq1:348-929(-)